MGGALLECVSRCRSGSVASTDSPTLLILLLVLVMATSKDTLSSETVSKYTYWLRGKLYYVPGIHHQITINARFALTKPTLFCSVDDTVSSVHPSTPPVVC